MANDLNIESISIEISANADNASKALDKLVEKLERLKKATEGGLSGAASISSGLKKIAEAAQEFNKIDSAKFTEVANGLKALNGIQNIPDLSSTAKQMKNISKIAAELSVIPEIPASKRLTAQNISSILSALSSAPTAADLSANVTQIKNLSKISTAIAALPDIPADKLQSTQNIVALLSTLSTIPQLPDLSGTARSLSQLSTVAASIAGTDMTAFSQRIQELANALQPLTTLGKTNLTSFINSLKKLPDITSTLAAMDMSQFATQMNDIADAIRPLTTEIQNLANAYSQLPAPVQNAVTALANLNRSTDEARNTTNLWGKALKALNFAGFVAIVRRVKSALSGFIENSNAYVENLNLFNVAMGDAADEALEFAERVNAVMGIDISTWIQNQGTFKAIATGFGMANEKANLLSQNLTQLGYDISSYFNISVEESMLKLQSGIAGELEPLRRIGYSLDVATLQQVAYNHGITESIQNMTQAQKAQIRYIAIMEQSGNVMQDMARTLESPANQMRILNERVNQLKRALGDALMPVVSALLPYVTAFVQLLGEAARKIAEFMGFELPVFDYSGVISSGNDEIAASFEDATAAAKEFKGTLSSIDQLNIIGSETSKNGTGSDYGYDLDIELPTYDFLAGLEENTSKAYTQLKGFFENLKQWAEGALPWIEAVGAAFGTIFVVTKIGEFLSNLAQIVVKIKSAVKWFGKWFKGLTGVSKTIAGITAGLAAGAASGVLFYNAIKKLTTGNGGIPELIGGIVVAGGAIAAFIALGNPVAAVVTGVVAAIGGIAGAVAGLNEVADKNAAERIARAFEKGETPIEDFAQAISDVSTKLTESETNYLTTKENLESISGNAETAGKKINEMVNALKGCGTLSEEEISTMKQAFEDLAKASEEYISKSNENFKLYILANQEMLQDQGFSVSAMVEIINSGTENSLNEIEKLKSRAEELMNLQTSVGLDTSQISELENINYELLKMSGVEVDFSAGFEKAQDVLKSLSSIRFTDPDIAASSIESALEDMTNAYSILEQTRKETLSDVERLSVSESDKEYLTRAIESLFKNKLKELNDTFSGPLQVLVSSADTLEADAIANEAEKLQELAENPVTRTLNFDTWKVIFGSTTYDELARERAQETLGEAATYVLNTEEVIQAAFAKKGLTMPESLLIPYNEWGEKAGQFIEAGIEQGWSISTYEQYAAELADRGAKAFCEKYGIHSPSTLFAEYGGYMMRGLADGISNNIDIVYTAIDNMSDGILQRMSQTYSEAMQEYSGYTSEDYMSFVGPKKYPIFGSYTSGVETSSPDEDTTALIRAFAASQPTEYTPVINVYAELDGDDVAAHVYSRTERQTVYSNGR